MTNSKKVPPNCVTLCFEAKTLHLFRKLVSYKYYFRKKLQRALFAFMPFNLVLLLSKSQRKRQHFFKTSNNFQYNLTKLNFRTGYKVHCNLMNQLREMNFVK